VQLWENAMLSTRFLPASVPDWSDSRRVSAGITAATSQQVPVACKGMIDPAVFQRLSRRALENTLPVGTEECHHALQGELCFTTANPYGSYTPTVPGDISLVVWTSFCGRSPDEPWVFRGVVAAPAYVGRGRKTDMTFKSSGTDTIINTGEHVIPEGRLVYARFPRAKPDAPSQSMHQQYGKPPNKFVAEVEPLDLENCYTKFCTFYEECDSAMFAAIHNQDNNYGAEHYTGHGLDDNGLVEQRLFADDNALRDVAIAAVDAISEKYRVEHTQANDPFFRAGRILVACRFNDVTGTGIGDKQRQEVLLHTEALNTNAALYGNAPTTARRALHNSTASLRGNSTMPLVAWTGCVLDYMNFLLSRVIGKALTTAASGQMFDILIGGVNTC